MPREAKPDAARRLDPVRQLEGDVLAARLLDAPGAQGNLGAADHIRSRDPRARLDAAAAQLHGGRSDLPFAVGSDEGPAPEAPRKTRER